MEYAQNLQSQIPDIIVEGGNYPVAEWRMMVAQVCELLFFGGLIASFFGMNFLPPDIRQLVQDNKMGFLGGLFMLKIVGAKLVETGAFEVYVGEKLIYSKLQTGGVPPMPNLLRLTVQALRDA
eukprot:PhF_6_TR19068/c0_g1_i1/m.28033